MGWKILRLKEGTRFLALLSLVNMLVKQKMNYFKTCYFWNKVVLLFKMILDM